MAIFDFDGTIANTLDTIVALYNTHAPQYSLPHIDEGDVERLRELSACELLAELHISPMQVLLLAGAFRSEMKKQVADVPIVSGMLEVFSLLEKHSVEVGIVTSNSVENVEIFLRKQHITSVSFIHSEKGLFGKGVVLKRLLGQKKLGAQDVVYIGDEVRDVDAARSAHIPIIAVSWGFNSLARLRRAKPDFLISRPEEIGTLILEQAATI